MSEAIDQPAGAVLAAKPEKSLRSFIRHGSEIGVFNPRLSAAIFTALLARTALEAYGLVLLVPALRLIGLGSAEDAGIGEHGGLMRFLNPLGGGLGAFDIGLVFLGVVAIRSIAGFACAVLTARLQAAMLHDLRTKYHAAIGRARWSYLVTKDPAHFTNGLTAQPEVVAYNVINLCSVVSAALGLFAGIAAALAISWELTLVTLAAAIVIALPLAILDLRFFRLSRSAAETAEQIYEHLGRRLGHLKLVRAQSVDGTMQADFERLSGAYANALERQAVLTARASALHQIAAALVIVGLGSWTISAGSGLTLEPAALTVIFARLVPRANQLQSSLRSALQGLPYYQSYRTLLDEIALAAEGGCLEAVDKVARDRIVLSRELQIDGVSYRYAARSGREALKNVTLSIQAGTATGVIGLNGAGKTTLLDVLAGLLTPAEGRVLADGRDLANGHIRAWRRSISYVLQEDSLVNDTILANLKLGQPDARDEQIWEALEKARAAALVQSLPLGLATRVGDRGHMFSRGQRQRLCLARALVARPALLLMDEGTSSLNPIDEQDLAETFRSLLPDTTIVAVSHRPSGLAWVDRLLMLEEGRVSRYAPRSVISAEPESLLRRMAESERRIARG